jgi:hypothetical protein
VLHDDVTGEITRCTGENLPMFQDLRRFAKAIINRGEWTVFQELNLQTQQYYLEVSQLELAAYICWRNKIGADRAVWEKMHIDCKREWVPEPAPEAKAMLEKDHMWKLLASDVPPCGKKAPTINMPVDGLETADVAYKNEDG